MTIFIYNYTYIILQQMQVFITGLQFYITHTTCMSTAPNLFIAGGMYCFDLIAETYKSYAIDSKKQFEQA